jgi:hypothetical protein
MTSQTCAKRQTSRSVADIVRSVTDVLGSAALRVIKMTLLEEERRLARLRASRHFANACVHGVADHHILAMRSGRWWAPQRQVRVDVYTERVIGPPGAPSPLEYVSGCTDRERHAAPL